MSKVWRALVVVSVASVAALGASPALAANADADFGQHVRMCAQTMGFDGTHNPGMHQGKSGWNISHNC